MILRKQLIEESGLTRDRAVLITRRLATAKEIAPVKDRYNHNQISYSEEDITKIKQAFQEEAEKIAAAKTGSGKTKEEKKPVGSGSPLPPKKEEDPPPTPGAKTAKELADAPGPKKREKVVGRKADEEEKPTSKLKELLGDNQQTLLLVAGGIGLLLFLLWLRGRRSTAGRPAQPTTSQASAQQAAKPAGDLSDVELKALRQKYNSVFGEF